jgi:S1-C subfamily serine protease
MIRFAKAFVVSALLLCPALAAAEQPDFKMKCVETRLPSVEVVSVDPEGLGWQMGFRKEDTILKINDKKIETKAELTRQLDALRGNFTILVKRIKGTGKNRKFEEVTLKGKLEESTKSPGTFYIQKQ